MLCLTKHPHPRGNAPKAKTRTPQPEASHPALAEDADPLTPGTSGTLRSSSGTNQKPASRHTDTDASQ